ncbi:hypothetical protein FA95DRAFT_759189 [Auriscalpium vulgare]|uniref:Uncharacterized protein n=1 Tax=Auriscalpium vulgare TaxID=40419 RepID=A0ACB8S245_9AGAM|nr:hypothetical protein FA95DRAFT_759189 [Auriscalpium vulgare]
MLHPRPSYIWQSRSRSATVLVSCPIQRVTHSACLVGGIFDAQFARSKRALVGVASTVQSRGWTISNGPCVLYHHQARSRAWRRVLGVGLTPARRQRDGDTTNDRADMVLRACALRSRGAVPVHTTSKFQVAPGRLEKFPPGRRDATLRCKRIEASRRRQRRLHQIPIRTCRYGRVISTHDKPAAGASQ